MLSLKCSSHKTVDVYTGDIPGLEMIEPSSQTQFVPVLEVPGEKGKNVIYAVSFALAWNEIRNKIGKPGDIQTGELKLIEQSESYKGALDSSEYVRETKVAGQTISVIAGFERELTYQYPMERIDSGFKFNGQSVRAFGMSSSSRGHDEEIGVKYYKNDDEFIIGLYPIERDNEIILAKGFSQNGQLNVVLDSIYAAIESARERDTASTSYWKYGLNDSDQVIMPVISFNLGNNFHEIEGAHISAGNQTFEIAKAYQRIGLVFNEYGTKVKSVAEVDVAAAIIDFPEKPPVKHLIFDKPFVLILKKSNVRNPYFMMKVENAALMVKAAE